ncbi:TonB-dependent siderophore receptor [Aliikangiella sp. G2MR2-5]|uniref:TonB-dependent receptor plug domain-containing protein n=1 Tax=Aliikangiella sp. G2MR2-5 TaxID=2788943 RepID=UPI0018A94908|nr:TonB-dependent receptor [Aliikangiella sp. G2MR2-5]
MQRISKVVAAVSAVLATIPVTCLADQASDKDKNKIVITGSHVKRLDNEASSPLRILTPIDIQNSGARTLSELLASTVLANGGALNNQQTGGFTPGAASYNLRGLRADRTLVLVDGKRLAAYPFGQNGNEAFVDLNTIPLAEVESVEILKDGASAVYGSDAIAGVVNVITHRTFNNHQVEVSTTQADSDYSGSSVTYVGGFNFAQGDLGLVAEIINYDSLMGGDTDFADQLGVNQLDEYSFPGTYFVNDGGATLLAIAAEGCERVEDASQFNMRGELCVNDWASKRQLMPANDRVSLSAKYNQYVGDSTFYANLSLNKIETESDVPFGITRFDIANIPASDPNNPLGQDIAFFSRAISETGLQKIDTEVTNTRLNVGFEGFLLDYDYDVSLSHSETKVDEIYSQGWMTIDSYISLYNDFSSGALNPFAQLTNAQLSNYTESFGHYGKSYQTELAGMISGEIAEWETGTVYFASGVEFRKEHLKDTSDQAILDSQVFGLGLSFAEGDRDVTALFAEFILPAAEEVEVNLALRYDDYSDFGSSLNPKLSASYRPSELFLFRASYGQGFRAPNLFELNGQVHGSVGNIPFISIANEELEAETSTSFNIGFVFDIQERFMTSIDLWQIEVDDMITDLGVSRILTATDENDNLIYQDLIVMDNGNLSYVLNPYVNLNRQEAQGFDLSSRLTFSENWSLEINVAHLLKLDQFNDDQVEPINLDGEYLFPKTRLNTRLLWETDNFRHLLSSSTTGEHGSDTVETDSYTRFDYQMTYSIDKHQFIFNVANISDEKPPLLEDNFWPFYEQRMYSPLGRTYSLNWKYQF